MTARSRRTVACGGVVAALAFSFFMAVLTAAAQQAKQPPTEKDIKAFGEAMAIFKQAEAMIGTARENSDEQADLFRKAIAIKPDFIEAHFNLGLIFLNRKTYKEAAAEFENVRKLNPDFEANGESIDQLLAIIYRELGQTDEAIAALKERLKKEPKDRPVLKALAYLQIHSSDVTAAIPTLETILELDPADTDSRANLGILFDKQNRLDEAEQCYRLVLEQNPADAVTRANLALLLLRRNKPAEAAIQLKAADKVSPQGSEIWERLGDSYMNQDQIEQAEEAFQTAVTREPERPVLLSKLAFTLARLNKIPEAVAVLEKSVALDPHSAQAFYFLGDLYSELQRYDDSVVAYNKSLKLDPRQKEVHYNLGTLYAESKHYGEARTELLAAIDIDPDYAAAWANLGIVCERLELDKDAIQAYEKVAALGKASAGTYFRLGILYAKANNPDPSIANFARAIQLEPDKYRAMLLEELKNVHSVLDCVRYKDDFIKLLKSPRVPW